MGGVFSLGNPDRRGVLVHQAIQVRGGLKNYPICRGCVDCFWNNPMFVNYKSCNFNNNHFIACYFYVQSVRTHWCDLLMWQPLLVQRIQLCWGGTSS